jgi:hypothetical protein
MLGGRYAVADAATGYWSQVCPSSWRPPAFGVRPPHCLKKNGTSERLQASRTSRAHFGSMGRAPGPLSPPTITQEMPVRSRSTATAATPGSRGLHAPERCATRRSRASVTAAISWPDHPAPSWRAGRSPAPAGPPGRGWRRRACGRSTGPGTSPCVGTGADAGPSLER